jgi:hypothetical protein
MAPIQPTAFGDAGKTSIFALWIPMVAFAHFFAAFWLVRTWMLNSPLARRKAKRASGAAGAASRARRSMKLPASSAPAGDAEAGVDQVALEVGPRGRGRDRRKGRRGERRGRERGRERGPMGGARGGRPRAAAAPARGSRRAPRARQVAPHGGRSADVSPFTAGEGPAEEDEDASEAAQPDLEVRSVCVSVCVCLCVCVCVW